MKKQIVFILMLLFSKDANHLNSIGQYNVIVVM